MKATKIFPVVLILMGILLSACAAGPSTPAAAEDNGIGDAPRITEIVFTGIIEGLDGDRWVINGQTVQVDASVVHGGPFIAGDTVKVEALVGDDGSVTAQRVESPSAVDLAQESATTASSTPGPLTFDHSGTEAFGTVESITDVSITIGGQTFPLAPGAEIKGAIAAGAFVKLHFTVNADGSLSVREVEIFDPALVGDSNSNDDNSNANSNDDNSNDNGSDDNGNDDNSNDDNGSDDDSNDDNGDNSNDDNDDDDNSNDDNDNG
jgi:hypothetical protein